MFHFQQDLKRARHTAVTPVSDVADVVILEGDHLILILILFSLSRVQSWMDRNFILKTPTANLLVRLVTMDVVSAQMPTC